MRKVMIWFLIMLFTLSMAGSALAKPANIIDALATANDELRSKNDGTDYFGTINKQGKLINEPNWEKNSLFSYGTPQEASPGSNNFDPVTKQYRYHGYTMNGEKYTNTFFRNDTTEIVDVSSNSTNWILRPWSNDSVQNFVINVMHEPKLEQINPFNNDPSLLESIKQGFENLKLYNPYIQFERTGKQWQEYVHVLQPPTKYTFGMGRLFRLVGGQMRYLTIPLPPLVQAERNLVAVSMEPGIPEGKNATVGQRYTGAVTFRNDSEEALTAPVGVWHNGYALNLINPTGQNFLSPGAIIFGPKGTPEATKKFIFEYGPVVGSKLLGVVNHAPTAVTVQGESNVEDNVVEATIPVSGYDVSIKVVPLKKDWKIDQPTVMVESTVTVKRKDNIPGAIPVKVTLNGAGGPKTHIVNLNPGEYKQYPYHFKAGPGTYTIHAEAWPSDGSWSDIHPPDNTARTTVNVSRMNLPKGDYEIRVGL